MRQYLFASDFDQTLSIDDSGFVLSGLLGAARFEEKVKGLSRLNLVQQGGELAYLLLHDPEYRQARREHLIEAGKRVRLKPDVKKLLGFIQNGIDGCNFHLHVISSAPEEIVQTALADLLPKSQIHGTRFQYHPGTGEIQSILRAPAGYGKVAVLDELQSRLNIGPDRIIYMGDGSSDIHAMLHVQRRDGYTIAVSEAKNVTQIARRNILSENAFSVVIPILQDIVGWSDPSRIRTFFENYGLQIQEWGRVRTDWLTVQDSHTGLSAALKAGTPKEMVHA
jgi:2-hydroxy-3-keto-5-methylthiopentenyl-1-phosphate phosphatase